MLKERYEQIYEAHGDDAFPPSAFRTRAFLAPLRARVAPGALILDLGCGVGYACRQLEDDGYRVAGADISARALESARARVPGGQFVELAADGRLPWPDGAFDGVACLGVLEHIPEPAGVVSECRRVLAASGAAVFVVPNSRSPYFFAGRGTGQPYERPRTRAEWTRLFSAGGFAVADVSRDPGPELSPRDGAARRLRILAHRLLNRLPLGMTYQFVFALVPAGGSVPPDGRPAPKASRIGGS